MKSVFVSACAGCTPLTLILVGSLVVGFPVWQTAPTRTTNSGPPAVRSWAPTATIPVMTVSRRTTFSPVEVLPGLPAIGPPIREVSDPVIVAQSEPQLHQDRPGVDSSVRVYSAQRRRRKDEHRFLNQIEQQAIDLRQASRDAFNRGLMPLPDLADRLDASLRMRMQVAESKNGPGAGQAELASHIRDLQSAAERLQRLGQPAAAGWAADVTYARLLVANARLTRDELLDDSAAASQAAAFSVSLAQKHFELRNDDFSLGLAGLPQMARAASYLSVDGRPMTFETTAPRATRPPSNAWRQYRKRLQQIVRQTGGMAQRGAEVGRTDYLQLAQGELAQATAIVEQLAGNRQAAERSFRDADRLVGDSFATRMSFYSSGTASLADLTWSWQQRSEIQTLMSRSGYQVSKESGRQQQDDLGMLMNVADGIRDLRGRNRADVLMVRSLDSLNTLRESKKDQQQTRSQPGRSAPAETNQSAQRVVVVTGSI